MCNENLKNIEPRSDAAQVQGNSHSKTQNSRFKQTLLSWFGAGFLLLSLAASPAQARTYIVKNTNDDGVNSLRWAINQVNLQENCNAQKKSLKSVSGSGKFLPNTLMA